MITPTLKLDTRFLKALVFWVHYVLTFENILHKPQL